MMIIKEMMIKFPLFSNLSWTATICQVKLWTGPPGACVPVDHQGPWSRMDNTSSSSEEKKSRKKKTELVEIKEKTGACSY